MFHSPTGYFTTFDESFINLFVLLTTANYPDVMMPYYEERRAYAIFFVVFIVVGLYMIFNMIFASIYGNYCKVCSLEIRSYLKTREKLLLEAFKSLDQDRDGKIDIYTWINLIKQVRPDLSEKQMEILFVMVDEKKTKYISEDEFTEICNYLDLRYFF